ncbi:MAG: hypothetical protein AAB932_01460, partial [Patescibacteria group bacterium]
MNWRNDAWLLGLHAALLTFLFFQLTEWRNLIIGLFLCVSFFLLLSVSWRDVLASVFGFPRHDFRTWILSLLASLLLFGWIGGIFVAWYRLTPLALWSVYALSVAITGALCALSRRHSVPKEKGESVPGFLDRIHLMKKRPIFLIGFFLLLGVGLYLVRSQTSDAALVSPWQTIPPAFLFVIFALILLAGGLVSSGFSSKTSVMLIAALSLLMHAYLPMSHRLPWGGDIWRLVAMEHRISQGESIRPVLFGPEASWSERWGIEMPDVFFTPQKYAYAQFWSLHVSVSETTGLPLLALSKYLIPIVWSIGIPIIFFFLGAWVFRSKKAGAWFSWLSLLPFSLQAVGALALPVSLGYIGFFFILLLFLRSRESRHPLSRWIVFLLSILMIFGYPLHTVVLWGVMILTGLTSYVIRHTSSLLRFFLFFCIAAIAVLLLPLIELISGVSKFPLQWNALESLRQLGGQLSGWYYASATRPH